MPIARVLVVCLAVVASGLVAVGCDPVPCTGEESVQVDMAGSCAEGKPKLVIDRIGCRVSVAAASSSTAVSLGLPLTGAVDQQGHAIRDGGWQVWGCRQGDEPCPADFRRCVTERVAWQLNVTCLDGSGALACQAVLTE